MAHAYTTKRGKNKLSKLGVRKDQQQNMERSLKKVVDTIKYDGPKEAIEAVISGHLGYSKSSSSSSASDSSILCVENGFATGSSRCAFSGCTTEPLAAKLLDCSSCFSVKYCGRDCQLADWG
jgi:hypothetical protein